MVDYGKAGAIAEEVLSAIRVVTSFGGQDQIVGWYVHAYTYTHTYLTVLHTYVKFVFLYYMQKDLAVRYVRIVEQ